MPRAMLSPLSRRTFLRRSAAAALAGSAFPHLIPSVARGADGHVAPSNRITLGLIGAGPQGCSVMKRLLVEADARVVAVCDVKEDRRAEASRLVNAQYGNQDCAVYGDFRALVARPDIDAVVIGTPDHWHVLTALAAVRAGKDVYVEKPLGYTLAEDWALRAAVQQQRRVFQFGTQQRSSLGFRRACELVRSGRIGKLKHINVWCVGSVPGGATAPAPVPPGIDYDFWLGPAPFKPYRENLTSHEGAKKTWWYNSDYSLGFISGWGVHPMDIAAWGCPDLCHGRLEVGGQGTIPTEGACDTATSWSVDFRTASGVTLNFRGLPIAINAGEAIRQHHPMLERYQRTCDHGTAFEGTEGWVLVDRDHLGASNPAWLKENPEESPVQLPRSKNHPRNFLDSVRSRAATVAPIEDACRSDTLCHLAALAVRSGRRLTWDWAAEKYVGDEAANRTLACRAMRGSWAL